MIVIKDLHKKYGDKEIISGLDLTIKQGETVAIIGPSGSGKSTLLRSINFLEIPTGGVIEIDGEAITEKNQGKMRKKVSMVFQHFNLFHNMTVLENIIYAPMKVHGLTREEATQKAHKLLERVQLQDKAGEYPSSLSGGQKQRIAIVRALLVEPEVILLDEPTSALDPEMVKEVLEFIQSLAHTGITVVMNTHEMNFSRKVADRIVFLDHGKVIEDAAPEDFFTNAKSDRVKAFLDKIC